MRKDDPISVSPQEEHDELFLRGQMISVSPNDDHRQHYLAHQEEAQRRTNDPGVIELVRHMRVHQQAFAMQQQAGGVQPQQGPRPFDPADAGKPGQPASAAGAFSDLNEQRQISNNGAQGAPGPVAPNRVEGETVKGGPR